MRIRSEVMNMPNAGPRRSSIRGGKCWPLGSTPAGRGRRSSSSTPWAGPRSDIAEVEVGFDEGGVAGVDVTGPGGRAEPVQVLESTRYGDGGLKTARVAFIARDVPSMGYATYHVTPTSRCRKG